MSDLTRFDVEFAEAFDMYRAAGWKRVFPLPAGEKDPPPKGITGRDGQAPDPDTVAAFRREPWNSNLGVAMPQDLIGIDVDQYGDKHGAEHLLALETRLGVFLPNAVWSSSRAPENPWGIRLYRVLPGLDWKGELCPDVDIISWHHRYLVGWPSIHPEGRPYGWYDDAGEPLERPPLVVGDHPDLPWQFIAHATRDPDIPADYEAPEPRRETLWHPKVTEAFDRFPGTGSLHNNARTASMVLARYEQLQLSGATAALDELGVRFITTVEDNRERRGVAAEWGRLADGARYKARTTESTVLQASDDLTVIPPSSNGTGDTEGSVVVVTLKEFAAVDEPGAEPLLGEGDDALIPANGDVMFYGDGGAGKTTLCVDLACHLAAGDNWLDITVPKPLTVLIIENEGPRPLFRKKLARKKDAWPGSPLDGRACIVETPWATLTFADETHRDALAKTIAEHDCDIVIIGPLTRSGMTEAGTLVEVRHFTELVADVRHRCGRAVTFILIHHENKGGKVSGAWEGAGDTLFHVQGRGHGHTRLYVQKARWSSTHHATTLELHWTDGEGFQVDEKPEISDDDIADSIVAAVREDPGTGWTHVADMVTGVNAKHRKAIRDRLLTDGTLVNVVKEDGHEVALDHCAQGRPAHLYVASDPTLAHLRPGPDEAETKSSSARGDALPLDFVPSSRRSRDEGRDEAEGGHPR